MNIREIDQEASALQGAIAPLLLLAPQFETVLLQDVAKIVQICGQSEGQIDPYELFAFFAFYHYLKKTPAQVQVALSMWERSPQKQQDTQKAALKIILELVRGRSNNLVLPYVLNQFDEQQGTNFLDKTVNALYRFAQMIVKADGQVTMKEMDTLAVIWKQLHTYTPPENPPINLPPINPGTPANPFGEALGVRPTPAPGTTTISAPAAASSATFGASVNLAGNPAGNSAGNSAASVSGLEQVLGDLNRLVGMQNIKDEVKTLTNFLKVQRVRTERGLAKTPVSLHSVFCGPPGTGKTTVARMMGKLLKELGFLQQGHLVETDRSGMVASHIGGTAEKVTKLVESALDGVLFIDEAYALKPKDADRDFGQEAIDVLLKRMEDHRDRLVVIVAGYTDEMGNFIEANPGLKSRFNRYFYFNDYVPEDLLAIFKKLCSDSHFQSTEAAQQALKSTFDELYSRRDRTFGNARLVRNIFEKTIERQANRLAVINDLTDAVLTTLELEDIPSLEAITPEQEARL